MDDRTGTRVVVVDDRTDAGATVAAVLGGAGFEAVTTGDLTATMEAVLHEGVAVVVAAHGSGGVGVSARFVQSLRDRPEPALRDVSVVALVDDPTSADAALSAGADSVLLRPVESDRLVEAVTDVAALDPTSRAARRRRR
jgi:DNA-binding NarL/FixJ family response regulator